MFALLPHGAPADTGSQPFLCPISQLVNTGVECVFLCACVSGFQDSLE